MFHIHRGERADALVDALVRVVSEPLDPFVAEVVAVPTRGVERWLTHRIAARSGNAEGREDGICANVDFPFPGRLVEGVLAEATGVDRDADPWRPERLVWTVLAELDAHGDDRSLGPLARHLGLGGQDPVRRSRRFATARRIAELFDAYGTFRPELVRAWAQGAPALADDSDRWQRLLWERVRNRIDRPSPAERLAPACERIVADPSSLRLPDRVSLFGLTRLPATYLDVLAAIAEHRDVHLFALHPSLALWDRIEAAVAADDDPVAPTGRSMAVRSRATDPTRGVARNPLLRTWGADVREMQLVLRAATDSHLAHHHVAAPRRPGLLARIQDDVRADRAPEATARLVLDPDDRSLQVHRTHGRARQVEVARDAICHALADDPTLEPRDVIVMCPDIDEFAPLLHAAFGADPGADPTTEAGADGDREGGVPRGLPALPYRLADRSLRQTNPVLGALSALLDLLDGRHGASELLALLGRDPVRVRFSLRDDDLERIDAWIRDAQVRWGLDEADRHRFSLGRVEANTWRRGIERILLGIAMPLDDHPLLDGRLPLDDVNSGDIDLAGRLAEFVDRFGLVVDGALERHDLRGWLDLLAQAVDLLFAVRRDDEWMRVQVDDLLADLADHAGLHDAPDHAVTPLLSLAELRTLIADRLRGVPTRADFRTGAITMCTMVPMRAVPHRVVCIIGLDDDAFPRPTSVDGDDLLRREPRVGDPDRRTEDRQLLLDAVLSATDTLILTTTGHDVRTNEVRPPAVPLAELFAVIDRSAESPGGGLALEQVVTDHALQPFDPRPHRVDRTGRRFAFDRVQLAGAQALAGPRRPVPPFLAEPLAPAPVPDRIDLDELTAFLAHPARTFLRGRLGISTWEDDERSVDSLPLELDGLERWQIGSRALGLLLDGHDPTTAAEIERARGALPPGALGQRAMADIMGLASRIVDVARDAGVAGQTTTRPIDVELDPRTGDPSHDRTIAGLQGAVAGIDGTVVRTVQFGTVRPRTVLDAWVRLLALTAADPTEAWSATIVGMRYDRQRRAKVPMATRLRPLASDPTAPRVVDLGTPGAVDDVARRAKGILRQLVELHHRGTCEPLPLPCEPAEAWSSGRGEREAARAWETGFDFDGPDRDPSWTRVLGGVLDYASLTALPATAAETGAGWSGDPSRFRRLAERVWAPIHAHTETPDRRAGR